MSRSSQNKILSIVATDSTFSKVSLGGDFVWQGKCIFCNKKLYIDSDGGLLDNATVEHITPRSKGGTEDLENLAIACRGCNVEKGIRHDVKKADKIRSAEVVDRLKQKRLNRWRDDVRS